ncbi:acyltransferase family protein [Parvularcula sp. LCG005]|uniref:acyltransferase family protein n=1 Tax=Parvularcula sp. LCG005 TaxID=3078805 RepID=UPI002942FF20|nr:heparan-alpha-glucosaminide N-acetyltransferase domain-containing protein [Parvularcula sp. LCG005]WOI53650.1 heparan-alpha-glucosaminide N-acetyltransferase domain-containing protein [Parvularcula sp. LCG005]
MDTVRTDRLISLDILRGMAVAGMILVNSMSLMSWSAQADVFPLLLHAHWEGLMLADLVFPAFLFMVGVAIPLSLGLAQGGQGLSGKTGGRIFWRIFRLFVLGFLLSNIYWMMNFDGSTWRLFGVLQRIALVYGACAALYLWLGSRWRLGLIVTILVLYWPLSLVPSPDGVDTDIWVRGQNFVAYVDRFFLGAGEHLYVKGPQGYDPEGVLGTLPAIAHGLIGVAVGEVLGRRGRGALSGKLFLAGAALLLIGALWGIVFPVVKDIWSSPFVLVTCGISLCVLALLHRLVDRGPSAAGSVLGAVFLPFGANAIAAYVLHILTASVPGWDVFQQTYTSMAPIIGEGWAAFLPVLLYLALIWAAMNYLYARRWVIKI